MKKDSQVWNRDTIKIEAISYSHASCYFINMQIDVFLLQVLVEEKRRS